MGVTGLWKLIESSGQPVPVETLENKVLAIDISIWLHQVVKGFQDNKGGSLPNAHLLGLFHRLCKLLYYRVKPVFVFDGGVPQLKRETMAKRLQSRSKLYTEADRLQDMILQNLVRDKAVQKALGQDVCEALISPSKQKPEAQKPSRDDMFKLPSLPNEKNGIDESSANSSLYSDSMSSDADSSFDEKNPRYSYQTNLQAIDVTSVHFKNLPADVRHEILTDIKETRKQSSWGRLHELPARANDFSGFQMKRLLKRRQVQVSLEEAEKQMEGRSLTLAELEALMSKEGILRASDSNATKRIVSDENTRFLLVKDLKKAMETAQKEAKEEEMKKETKEEAEGKNSEEILGEEYKVDLQKAIEMSLDSTQVYKDDDYNYDTEVKLNKVQQRELKVAANSLARAYMLEYGGMNDEDIKSLMHGGINDSTQTDDLQSSFNFQHNDRFITKGEICTPYKDLPGIRKISKNSKPEVSVNSDEVQYISSSSDDSDLEIVDDVADSSRPSIEILVNPACAAEDDLFADIFEKETENVNAADPLIHTSDEKKEVDTEINQLPKQVTQQGNRKPSTDLKSNSTKHILDELNEEIKQVSAITLDVIGEDIKPLETLAKKEVFSQNETSNKKEVQFGGNFSKSACECLNETETGTAKTSEYEGENSGNACKRSDITHLKEGVENVEIQCMENLNASTTKESVLTQTKISTENISNLPLTDVNSKADLGKIRPNLEEILQYVKQQSSEAANISLDDIKPSVKTSDISINLGDNDIENVSKKTLKSDEFEKCINTIDEIIEIPDDNAGIRTPSKSSGAQSSIDNFFETKFTIKRTPDKAAERENSPPPPKVTSPFFVNKKSGGSSGRKRRSPNSDDGTSRNPKIAKQLFDHSAEKEEVDDDIKPLDEDPSVDLLEEVALALKENKSQSELANIAGDIREENVALEMERNKQSRMATSITDKMAADCQQLLRLFGIPYVVAPMEAEAQCAFLDAIKLTDGTITDDSDIWLFGGCTVYKNFFNQKKHVLEFKMENIEKLYSLNRHKLIQLAILVGSDYTTGVNGIGAVTAIEILANFPITPIKEGETTENMSVLSSLRKFRDWWKTCKAALSSGRSALRSKLKNVQLNEGFPNMNIVDAYLHPRIDGSRARFVWGEPDVETIREFAKTKFGWTRTKTDEILQPVLKRVKERKTQATIKNYFSVKSATTVRELKVSKRVQKAIDKMSGDYVDSPSPKMKERKRRKKSADTEAFTVDEVKAKEKPGARKRRTKLTQDEVDGKDELLADEPRVEATKSIIIPKKVAKKSPNIPNPKQPIPQREKDKKDMELRKEKAIEIFQKKK